MVSRRNYFSIVVMMAVLFFMFQFSQVIKDSGNRYDVNGFAVTEEDMPSGKYQWEQEAENVVLKDGGYVLFLGEKDNELGKVIAQWCIYTKRELVVAKLSEYKKPSVLPELILLDSVASDVGRKSVLLEPVMELGVPVVFCNLPDASAIQKTTRLQKMLGISEIREPEIQVKGIQLFEGFLLGGEAIYEATTAKEQKRQDMDLTVPWYLTGSGTKTYMVGILDDKVVKREEFPSLVWRNTYKETKVYAVEGDYMSTLAGLGFLSAFTYELESYELYPVINAQNVTIANFPGFSEENGEELTRLYSRSPRKVFQDIMWPSISAMTETNDLKLTCLFQPQYDYEDALEPKTDGVTFYLQQLKELNSEAGISIKYKNTSFEEALTQDEAFYQATGNQYEYQAVFVESTDLEKATENAAQSSLLANAKTFVCESSAGRPLVSYLTDSATLQNITGDARKHSYMDNLLKRSILTSLGYSNVLLDLHDAIWPQKVADEWQNLYDTMSSNVRTFWSGKGGFEETTLSESDMRVRNFLNLDYQDGRNGNTIVLKVSNFKEPAWFLLRTHAEKIVDIRGGEYLELEQDAYLIKVVEETVAIDLEQLSLREQSLK